MSIAVKWNEKQRREFDESLPMSRELFEDLLDCLSASFEFEDCNHSYQITRFFLENQDENIDLDKVIEWLKNHRGSCDCEVLINLEKYFFM